MVKYFLLFTTVSFIFTINSIHLGSLTLLYQSAPPLSGIVHDHFNSEVYVIKLQLRSDLCFPLAHLSQIKPKAVLELWPPSVNVCQ